MKNDVRAKLVISIVDDHVSEITSLSTQVSEICAKLGTRVSISSFCSASDFLSSVAVDRPDLVFLDYYFEGGMSGLEAYQRIPDPFNKVQIVLFSGRSQEELDVPVGIMKSSLFLRKPLEAIQLKATIQQALLRLHQRELPSPLRDLRSRVDEEGMSNLEYIRRVRDLIEWTACVGALCVYCDISRHESFCPEKLGFERKSYLGVGSWLMLLKLCQDYIPHLNHINKLRYEELLSVLFRLLLKYNPLRVNYAHESVARPDEAYAPDVKACEQLVQLWDSALYALQRIELIAPLSMSQSADELRQSKCNYKIAWLDGRKGLFPTRKVILDAGLLTKHIYAYMKSECVSLWPYMIYSWCATCEADMLFRLDRVINEKVAYRGACGHTLYQPCNDVQGIHRLLDCNSPDVG